MNSAYCQNARRRRGRVSLCLTALVLVSPAVLSATLTEHMDITCVQDEASKLSCAYRLVNPGELRSAIAEFAGIIVDATQVRDYPQVGQSTAVMILVDTSDPAQQPVVEKNISHIGSLLDAASPHHNFGLATFDTNLFLLAPIGSDRDEIRAAAGTLVAKGKTTELYRNVLDAVRLLGQDRAARKLLLIMSDGLAEDYAYHHSDVVTLAREQKVIIASIGYPRSVGQSVALQTIRRLGDETGGAYVQATHTDYSIPAGFFNNMLSALDSGGTLEFDLSRLIDAQAVGAVDLSLGFQTADQSFLVLAPVVLPGDSAVAAPADEPEVAGVPVTTPSVPPYRPAVTPPARPLWPWMVVLLVLLVTILSAVIVLAARLRRSESSDEDGGVPLAYLILQDESFTRHAITKTPWRIGRGKNNELTLSDTSVSRLHAEIRDNDQGGLILNDLESLNGVFVNDDRVRSAPLFEGDAVDIGDVRLQFTLHDEAYTSQEPTVLVRTRAPM